MLYFLCTSIYPSINHIFNEKLTKCNSVQYEGKILVSLKKSLCTLIHVFEHHLSRTRWGLARMFSASSVSCDAVGSLSWYRWAEPTRREKHRGAWKLMSNTIMPHLCGNGGGGGVSVQKHDQSWTGSEWRINSCWSEPLVTNFKLTKLDLVMPIVWEDLEVWQRYHSCPPWVE